jgi:hypothetical protein
VEGKENDVGLIIFGENLNILEVSEASPIESPTVDTRVTYNQTWYKEKMTLKSPKVMLS